MHDEDTLASRSAPDATTSFWDVVKGLATYVGFPGFLLYPAGFLLFVLQISSFYPFSFWTAWYVVSLIPAAVITGEGAKVLLGPLVLSSVVSLLFGRTLIPVDVARVYRSGLGWLRSRLSPGNLPDAIRTHPVLTVSTIVLSVFLVPVSVMLLAHLGSEVSEAPGTIYWICFLPPAIIFGLLGGWLISHDYRSQYKAVDERSPSRQHWGLLRGATEGWIIRGLLLAYAGAVLSAFVTVFPMDLLNQDPDLPHVKMTVSDGVRADGEGTIEDGLLLAHSDGYWHVIDTSNRGLGADVHRQSFLVLPTSAVEEVKVYESPMQKADVDLKMDPDGPGWVNRDFGYAWEGKDLGYVAKVTNHGPDSATSVRLTVKLSPFTPANRDRGSPSCRTKDNAVACDLAKTTGTDLTIDAQDRVDPSCVAENNAVTCELGKLDTNESAEIDLTAKPEVEGVRPVPSLDVEGAEVDPDASDQREPDINLWVHATAGGADYTQDTWTNKDVAVNLLATDELERGVRVHGKGVMRKPQEGRSRGISITEEGTSKVVPYHAQDEVGRANTNNSFVVKLDKTAPLTVLNSDPRGATDDETPTFTFAGSDKLSPSLLFSYRVDGGPWSPFRAKTNATVGGAAGLSDAPHAFFVRARDAAGNKDVTPQERTFTVDTSAPHTIANATTDGKAYAPGTWTNKKSVLVNLSANDPEGSGVQRIAYAVDGGRLTSTQETSVRIPTVRKEGTTNINYLAEDNAGNTRKGKLAVKLDTAPPETRAILSPEPNDIGWNTGDVTLDFTADDKGDSRVKGITYSATGAQKIRKTSYDREKPPVITEQGVTRIAFHAEDNAGNLHKKEYLTVDIDRTAPSVALDSGPTGSTDNDQPTFTFHGSDGFPKNDALRFFYRVDDAHAWLKASGTSATLGDTEGLEDGRHTIYVKVEDEAGNRNPSPAKRRFTVDTTDPKLDLPGGITREATSEDGAEIAYEATATDEQPANPQVGCSTKSGPVSPGDTFPIVTTTLTCKATDEAGNEAQSSFGITVEDTTKPTPNCERPGDVWHKKDATIPCTAKDVVSGVAGFSLSTHVPTGSATENAATGSRKVCDEAGNCATAGPIKGIKVDKEDPKITITLPENGADYEPGESVAANYDCTDTGSGLAACEGALPSGADIDTSLGAPRSFKVEAKDVAGNKASVSHTYTVAYAFGGFLPPIEGRSTLNVVRAGDAILVRFGLGGDRGTDVFAHGYPRSHKIDCGSGSPVNPIGKGNLRHTNGVDHYAYAWNTYETWSGTCRRLNLKLKDGSKHEVYFEFME